PPEDDRSPAAEQRRALQGMPDPGAVLLRRQVLDRQGVDALQRLRDRLGEEVRIAADDEDGGDGRGHAAMLLREGKQAGSAIPNTTSKRLFSLTPQGEQERIWEGR